MRVVATLTATALALFLRVPSAHAFDDTLKSHGGFYRWHGYRTMRFDLKGWPVSPGRGRRDVHVVDIPTGARMDGGASLPLDPFQFVGMPFVLAEPGVRHEELGLTLLEGRRYEGHRFEFQSESGMPGDVCIAYLDDATHELALAVILFADPGLAPHVIVFEEWQEANGLTVPRLISIHEWVDGRPGPLKAAVTVENAAFDQAAALPRL